MNSGDRLGPYEIAQPLGAGGMGEVWLATDTRLGRKVAIKLLPPALADDPERLARFEREARVLASLNHPGIAAIHGLERVDGRPFISMELVEGADLAQVLETKGALAVEEAIDVARQIAEALEAAHEAGIVHRDLKPANVRLTPAGKVKVLDFGLAKAREIETTSGAAAMTQSPTMMAATAAGVILGTAAYMSPEQARGRPVDKRTDVFAFGCVLYELLTARKPFDGDTVTDVLAAIVTREPDLAALPADTPASVRSLLRRCLEKRPELRLRDIGEARIALAADALAAAAADGTVVSSERRPTVWTWAVALLASVALTAVAVGWLRPAAETPLLRVSVDLPPGMEISFHANARPSLAVSSDGNAVAFAAIPLGAGSAASPTLWVRDLAAATARQIEGTEGAELPAFSPDGRWLAYFARGWLLKVPVSGGPPVRLASVANPWGIDWSEPQRIVVSWPRFSGEMLQAIDADGAAAVVEISRTDFESRLQDHSFPWRLDEDVFLITGWSGGTYAEAYIAALETRTNEATIVLSGGSNPAYVPGGFLVYGSARRLLGVPFDPATRRTTGTPLVMSDDVVSSFQYATPQFAVSRSGTAVYAAGAPAVGIPRMVWLDGEGRTEVAYEDAELAPIDASLSPDGRRMAFSANTDGNVDVYVHDLGSGSTYRVTSEETEQQGPIWVGGSDRVAYSDSQAQSGIYLRNVNGSEPRLVTTTREAFAPLDVSADGRWLLVRRYSTAAEAYTLDMIDLEDPEAGSRSPLEDEGGIATAKFAPAGDWIAYVKTRAGSNQMWLAPREPREGSLPLMVVERGVELPIFWSRDGRRLYYNGNRGLSAVDISWVDGADGARPEAGAPIKVLEGPADPNVFGIDRDGRFLALLMPQVAPITQLQVITNVGALLERLSAASTPR